MCSSDLEVHKHVHEQICYIAQGSFKFDLNGDVRIVKQGDSVCVASNLLHGVEALEASVIVDIFTPKREDFLK